jgi:hypothetical protein
VDAGDAHVFELYHFYRKILVFVVIADALVDATAETAPYQIFEVETVPTDSFFAFGRRLWRG